MVFDAGALIASWAMANAGAQTSPAAASIMRSI
jgi:hypothetical protein